MALGDELHILSHEPCVDAMLHTKADAIPLIAEMVGLSLDDFVRQTAVIDDGDTTFLTDPAWADEYKLIAAPANAKERVKVTVSTLPDGSARPNGFVTEGSVYEGFSTGYWVGAKRGAKFYVSDRDGVMRRKDEEYGDRFFDGIGRNMGGPRLPTVIVLTGSSVEQNIGLRHDPVTRAPMPSFVDAYGFPRAASAATPYLVVCENGGVAIDVRDKSTKNLVEGHNPWMLERLTGRFGGQVLSRVQNEVAPRFGFGRARDEDDQDGNIYVPNKFSMLTVNCPRVVRGDRNWRLTPESDDYRRQVLDIMVETAERLGMPYRVIGSPKTA